LSTNNYSSYLSELREELGELGEYLDLKELREKVHELQSQMSQPDFWDDQGRARRISREASRVEDTINQYESLHEAIDDLEAMVELEAESEEASFSDEIERGLKEAKKKVQSLRWRYFLDGEYDDREAMLSINPGAGGTEAHDWAEMLYRMYRRWCENEGIEYSVLNVTAGEEAGIKNATMQIKDDYAYGRLKGEAGVHRLVRISPFDSSSRRHTSFAAVEVMPDLDVVDEVDLDETDLKIDTFRSSGPGGQHANMTDSAVRIIHEPTGLVAKCENERSQHKNRETAMKILKSRLLELKIEEQKEDINELRGEKQSIEWGSQIRSYVNHPYQQVKDHRTNCEVSSFETVLDGEINEFIEAYLSSEVNQSSN